MNKVLGQIVDFVELTKTSVARVFSHMDSDGSGGLDIMELEDGKERCISVRCGEPSQPPFISTRARKICLFTDYTAVALGFILIALSCSDAQNGRASV